LKYIASHTSSNGFENVARSCHIGVTCMISLIINWQIYKGREEEINNRFLSRKYLSFIDPEPG
jgi:hypothetical protein